MKLETAIEIPIVHKSAIVSDLQCNIKCVSAFRTLMSNHDGSFQIITSILMACWKDMVFYK